MRKIPVIPWLCALLLLSGCGTMFDFGPVDRNLSTPSQDLSDLSVEALDLAGKYKSRVDWSANSAQALEVPIIGAAILGVTSLAFGGSVDIALAAGAAAGGSAAFLGYYAPRARAKIYQNGVLAMHCLATLAAKIDNSQYLTSNLAGSVSNYLLGEGLFTIEQNAVSIAALVSASVDKTDAFFKISNAINQVNGKIFEQSLDASAAPNFGAILTNMQNTVAASQRAKTDLEDKLKNQNNISPVDIAAALNLQAVKLGIELDTEIQICLARAGTT